MRRKKQAIVLLVVLITSSAPFGLCSGSASAKTGSCIGGISGSTSGDSFDINGEHSCLSGTPTESATEPGSSKAETPQPLKKTVDCGPRSVADHPPALAGGASCAIIYPMCPPIPGQVANTTITMLLSGQTDGTWQITGHDCDAPVQQGLSPEVLIRQEIARRVPHAAVGVAPPGGTTLVNIETLLWADTAPDRDLGTMNLLGQTVQLQVHATDVQWDFGDGHTQRASTPGHPYDQTGHPCRTRLCSDYYFGHVYTTTGQHLATARITWQGRFRMGNAGWQTIAQTVDGPTATVTITVREARAVLVPNPAER